MYERYISLIMALRHDAQYTSSAHYDTERRMRYWKDIWTVINQVSGVGVVVTPIVQSLKQSLPDVVFVGFNFACVLVLFAADQYSKHFDAEDKKKHEIASAWRELFDRSNVLHEKVLGYYLTASTPVSQVDGEYMKLAEQKIALHHNIDSITNENDYAVINKRLAIWCDEDKAIAAAKLEEVKRAVTALKSIQPLAAPH